ncbi:hypothetical protein [Pseudovibrio sp. Tun.PSC04-5.I4]|uniref:hypothetical protein n=1 Tax=Pseudovibrio sp. Tun.PSC04-5.I4 TaxID=1798213 RepID=UPI000A55DCD2|nr:hypothetical protein [Pseudovibrio sp. Tun.PSC04-5.I4]
MLDQILEKPFSHLGIPAQFPRPRLPKDEHDLMAMAQNGHVLNFDNVSKMESWLSDAICRLRMPIGSNLFDLCFSIVFQNSRSELNWQSVHYRFALNG